MHSLLIASLLIAYRVHTSMLISVFIQACLLACTLGYLGRIVLQFTYLASREALDPVSVI